MIEKIKQLLSEAEKELIYAKAKIEVYNSVIEIAEMECDTETSTEELQIEDTSDETQSFANM